VLLVSVPESRRQLRHRLRSRLAWTGLGSPTPGVWVTPDPAKQDEVARVIGELDLAAVTSSFVGPYGAIGAERDVVRRRGTSRASRAAYVDFLDTFATAAPSTPSETMTGQIHLVHAWRRFPFLDPALPAELLPEEVGGRAGRRALRRAPHALDAPAQRHWRALLGSAG
jgi:phenylacetic acid degradation operon negative regulatory protein